MVAFASEAIAVYLLFIDLVHQAFVFLLPMLVVMWAISSLKIFLNSPPTCAQSATPTLRAKTGMSSTRDQYVQTDHRSCHQDPHTDTDTIFLTSAGKCWHKNPDCPHLKVHKHPVTQRPRCRTCG